MSNVETSAVQRWLFAVSRGSERPCVLADAQQLETLNVSYASVTGSRIPLWIAKDAGLFEKYGLNVNLVVIAAGTAAIGALTGGDVEILGAPGSTTMVSAAQGLAAWRSSAPSVRAAWKLVAHPSITSVQELRGKTVGISRLGTTIEFATRRALVKLGLTPGKDVQILATGLSRVEQTDPDDAAGQDRCDAGQLRIICLKPKQKNMKLSVLADLKRFGDLHQRQRSLRQARFSQKPAPAGARVHDGVLRSDLARQSQ